MVSQSPRWPPMILSSRGLALGRTLSVCTGTGLGDQSHTAEMVAWGRHLASGCPLSVFAASRKSATASCEHFLPRGGGPRGEELGPPADSGNSLLVGSPGPAVPPVAVALNSAWLRPCERPGARTTRLGSSWVPDPQKLMWPRYGLTFDSREFKEGFLNLDFQRKFYVKKCMQGFCCCWC